MRHDGTVTDSTTAPAPAPAPGPVPASPAPRLPPDPAQYDAPRNVAARSRGLAAPYISGGDDPELAETLRRERRDLRLLVGMALVLVLLGFVLGIVSAIVTALGAG